MAMIQLAAFWMKEKGDKVYYSGNLGNATVLLFQNNKTKDNQPDLIMYVAEPIKKNGGKSGE